MNLADVFTFLFIILGFVIVYIGYWLMAAGLFPKAVEGYAAQIGRAPIATTLLGAATFIPLVLIFWKVFEGKLKVVGIGIVMLLALAALFGSAGLALRIGEGLPSPRDAQEPWRRVLRGGIVLALTFVMPFVGWLLVMPLAFLSGFGAMLIHFFRRESHPLNQMTMAATPASPAAASGPPALPVTVP